MKHIFLTALLLVSTVSAYAGPGHHHDSYTSEPKKLNEEEVLANAKKILPQLVEQGFEVNGTALDESWKGGSLNSKVKEQGPDYYIISFKGDSKKILFLLMSWSGDLYEANFSGKFDGLKP